MEFDALTAINTIIARKTKQEREEEAAYQAERRAELQLPTPIDVRAQLGARMVDLAQEVLTSTDDDFEYTRMAEGYALQGDYRKAVLLTRDDQRKRQYEAIIAAVDVASNCPCPPKNGSIPNVFTKDRILFDGQVRELLCCAVCGHLKC